MEALKQCDVARQLGVHVNTVGNMLDDGRLTPVEFGNFSGHQRAMRRVARESVDRLVRGPRRAGIGAKKWQKAA